MIAVAVEEWQDLDPDRYEISDSQTQAEKKKKKKKKKDPTTKPARQSLGKAFNLPNQLTALRLLFSVVLFALIACRALCCRLGPFLIAVGTDWLDGYFARKYNQITTLGRILDPFADKVIICGTFIFLVTRRAMLDDPLLSAGLDGRGDCRPRISGHRLAEFPGRARQRLFGEMSGKLKMVLQCVAAGSALVYLHYLQPRQGDSRAAPVGPVGLLVYGRFHLGGDVPHRLLWGGLRLDRLQAAQAEKRRAGHMTGR